MQPSSLRALLLAFAMVLQAMAGGFGAAHAMPGFEQGVSTHCGQTSAADHSAGEAGRDTHRQMCESCLLCAGPPPLSVAAFDSVHVPLRAFQRVRFIGSESAKAPPRLACARLARGPPAFL